MPKLSEIEVYIQKHIALRHITLFQCWGVLENQSGLYAPASIQFILLSTEEFFHNQNKERIITAHS